MEKKSHIHFAYIIGFLVVIIILFATVKWGEIPDLVKYITFALTLTSLVLAVLAIIYAFFSNSSISGTVSSLQKLSEQVSNTTSELAKATNELKQEVAVIPVELRSVKGGLEELKEYSQKRDAQKELPSADAALDQIVNPFLARASNHGLWMLRSCKESFEKKIAFDQYKLTSEIPRLDSEYSYGFLVAVSSVGLLAFTVAKGRLINMTRFNESLLQGIDKEISKRRETGTKEHQDMIDEVIEAIRNYFK